MKIHPLFERAIWTPYSSYVGEPNPIDEWESAGKPVVEKEPKPPRYQTSYIGVGPNETDLGAAMRRVQELEKDLDAVRATWSTAYRAYEEHVKERDEKILGLEAKLAVLVSVASLRRESRNATLEEAAGIAEENSWTETARKIRALKKP